MSENDLTTNRVCFVDDQSTILNILKSVVRNHLPEIEPHFFTKAQDALDFMKDGKPTVIVTDWQMPEIDGVTLTKKLIEAKDTLYPYHYIIFLTSKDDAKDLAHALHSGAHDYIKKPFNKNELIARVLTGIRTLDLEVKLKNLNDRLITLSTIDGLTGLFNRRYGNEIIEKEYNKVSRGLNDLCLYLLDIDHFKKINDHHGHNAGDAVLVQFAKRLKEIARSYDSIIRWGGEEFIIVCPNLGKEPAQNLASRILKKISETSFQLPDNNLLQVTTSIGIRFVPVSSKEPVIDLINQADAALYHAKNNGRNQYTLFQNES